MKVVCLPKIKKHCQHMVIDVDILILICSFNFFKEKKSRPYYHLQIFVGGEYGDLGIHYIYAERVAFL